MGVKLREMGPTSRTRLVYTSTCLRLCLKEIYEGSFQAGVHIAKFLKYEILSDNTRKHFCYGNTNTKFQKLKRRLLEPAF